MPIDALRGRIHHDVGSEIEWIEQIRRGERVVHDERDAMRVRDAGERAEVGDGVQRIRHAFDEQCLGVRADPFLPGPRIVGVVREVEADAIIRQHVREGRDGSAVQPVRGEDAPAARRDVQDGVAQRGETGGCRHGAAHPMQRGQALFEYSGGRIGDARVDVVIEFGEHDSARVLFVRQRVCGRLVQRHAARMVVFGGIVARVQRERGE